MTPEADAVNIRVLWFDGWGWDDDRGRELLNASCSIAALREAVTAGAQAVLDEHGLDGYRQRWVGHDFPIKQLNQLRSYT